MLPDEEEDDELEDSDVDEVLDVVDSAKGIRRSSKKLSS